MVSVPVGLVFISPGWSTLGNITKRVKQLGTRVFPGTYRMLSIALGNREKFIRYIRTYIRCFIPCDSFPNCISTLDRMFDRFIINVGPIYQLIIYQEQQAGGKGFSSVQSRTCTLVIT